MSGSMADHECKCVLCSKSLLQANERDRLVDRMETDTLTRISDELQQVGGVKLNISAIARRVLCRSCTTKIKCAVHWIQDLTHLKKDIQNTLAIHIPASTRTSQKRRHVTLNKETRYEPNASQQPPPPPPPPI